MEKLNIALFCVLILFLFGLCYAIYTIKNLSLKITEAAKKPVDDNSVINTVLGLRDRIGELNQNIGDKLSYEAREERNSNALMFGELQRTLEIGVNKMKESQEEKLAILEKQGDKLHLNVEKNLENIKTTVEEKLSATLKERIGQSFSIVSNQLESVQRGLGEMQAIAQDVGGLKKVLSNVKLRGGLGELQLSMLLENILAPSQYEANVKTKLDSLEVVEFAIKLPGDTKPVWLPIDAKFPSDYYSEVVDAYAVGEQKSIDAAGKNLENAIKKMANDISVKYIDPPNTTDFAIMFLPFEGIYAEVARRAGLIECLQTDYKIVIAGPSTLAVILNSLQMGFKTLAIQQRSSEVWTILEEVRTEFENFSGLLEKAKKNIETAGTTIDDLIGKRTRAIQRKLKHI